MDTQHIISQIEAVSTLEDMTRVEALIQEQPGKMIPEIQTALLNKLKQVTEQSRVAREEMISILSHNGVDYPLNEWLTPKNYAIKFGIKNVETILNWINRGVIPTDNIKEISELGLRLVKAVEYSPRTYKERDSVQSTS